MQLKDVEPIIRELQDEEQYGADYFLPIELLKAAPTIEAKPVVHGRNLSADTPSQFECSVCGCEDCDTYTCDVDVYKYCPNCGAQMDEKESD